MIDVAVTPQSDVLAAMEWHPAGEGHDFTCYRRHPHCAEEYVSRLQSMICCLDSDLRRLLDGFGFEERVAAEVERRVAAMQAQVRVVEKRVEVAQRDPKRDALLMAVEVWLEALEDREELRERYGLDEDVAYMHETPDDYVQAEWEVSERETTLRKAAEGYFR